MIKIISETNGTDLEKKKLDYALNLVNNTWNSVAFKSHILSHKKLNGALGFENTTDTNEQVWEKLQASNPELNIFFYMPNFFQRFHNIVVGYEDDEGVHINKTFFDKYDPCDVACNIAHETCHEIGYIHDFENTAIRPFSVPYAIGAIIGELRQFEVWPNYTISDV